MTSTTIVTKVDPKLADEINEHHRLCENAALQSLEHGIAAGHILAGIKDELEHGDWQPWVAENLVCSLRRAQEYMQAATNEVELMALAKARTSAHLTFDAAVKKIRKPLERPKVDRTPAPTSREASPAVAGMEDDDNIAQTPEWRNLSNRPTAPTSPPTLVVTGWTDSQTRKAQRIKDALCNVLDSLDDSQRDGQSDYNVRETLRSAERTAKDAQVLLSELAFSFDR